MVHYRHQPEDPPQAAIVVYVFDINDPFAMVNLSVFSEAGAPYAASRVGRYTGDGMTGPSWDWPAFVAPFEGDVTEPQARPVSAAIVANTREKQEAAMRAFRNAADDSETANDGDAREDPTAPDPATEPATPDDEEDTDEEDPSNPDPDQARPQPVELADAPQTTRAPATRGKRYSRR